MNELFENKKEVALVKIEPAQLDEVVNNSGLAIQEATEIKAAYLPFLSQLADIQSNAKIIDFENPGENDELNARSMRLATVRIRTGAEKQKDDRKKMYLLRGNMEQASFNLIATACKMTEEIFMQVEKAREIAERARKEQLRQERIALISPFVEDTNTFMLGEMTDTAFQTLLAGAKSQYYEKLEAAKKAEEERIAKEKAEAEERERIRLDNIRLQKEAEEREKQMAAEREKARKAQELKDKQIAQERAAAEAARKAAEEKNRKEQEEKDRIITEQREKARKEQEEKERLQAEIRVKEAAAQKAIEDEKKSKAAEEKRNRLAPDKDKLLNFMQLINDLPRPDVKSIEAANVVANANTMLVNVANFIRDNAGKL